MLGALLGSRVGGHTREGLAGLGAPAGGNGPGGIPGPARLPEPVRTVVESAYGHGVADAFPAAAPVAALALVLTVFVRETVPRTRA